MKNIILLYFLAGIISCAPKYTAGFQDFDRTDRTEHNEITISTEEVITDTSPVNSEIPPIEMTVSSENRPVEFKSESILASPTVKEHRELKTHVGRKKEKVSAKEGENGEGNPKKNVLAIMGFIFGILSLVPLYGIIFSVPAIVISAIGMNSEKNKLAMAGLILGIAGLILGTIWWIIYFTSW